MGKALFFDVDGTLVNFQGKMPESARAALIKAQQNGHQIVLCSGRSKIQIYSWLLELGFDGIVAATGAYVECGGKVLYRHFMTKEELRTVTALLDEADACYSAQAGNRMITSAKHRERQMARFKNLGDEEMIDYIWSHVEIADDLVQFEDIEKIVYYESKMPVQEIRERLSGMCDVTESSFEADISDSGEITCSGINKAYGIQKYIEYAGIDREDTVAFGDGPNDFDMIEYAATGVVMGNAQETLKSRADFVTKGIDEDGLAYAMEALGLI
ncbi:MAG: Cof-type HAD-IIB family hydrolase [Eubacterium sp.]|nr:Cof-type HAD-IIB family hydrolase [Eubacterium sp.]